MQAKPPQHVNYRTDPSRSLKALALAEAGICAVGIGGINSAMPNGRLLPALKEILKRDGPKMVYFLGDTDTAINFFFSVEAVKLAKALPQGCELRLSRIPLDSPKASMTCAKLLAMAFSRSGTR
jgi:hypothetical protein